MKLKPATAKGVYLQGIAISHHHGPRHQDRHQRDPRPPPLSGGAGGPRPSTARLGEGAAGSQPCLADCFSESAGSFGSGAYRPPASAIGTPCRCDRRLVIPGPRQQGPQGGSQRSRWQPGNRAGAARLHCGSNGRKSPALPRLEVRCGASSRFLSLCRFGPGIKPTVRCGREGGESRC